MLGNKSKIKTLQKKQFSDLLKLRKSKTIIYENENGELENLTLWEVSGDTLQLAIEKMFANIKEAITSQDGQVTLKLSKDIMLILLRNMIGEEIDKKSMDSDEEVIEIWSNMGVSLRQQIEEGIMELGGNKLVERFTTWLEEVNKQFSALEEAKEKLEAEADVEDGTKEENDNQ